MNKEERYRTQFPNTVISDICVFDNECDTPDDDSACDCGYYPHKYWCQTEITHRAILRDIVREKYQAKHSIELEVVENVQI